MRQTLNKIRDHIFKKVHGSQLIYNTCWEDPRCDRHLLKIGNQSRIVMITSAGCNAFDYLPDFVKASLEFDHESARRMHFADRVGTYGSCYLGVVKGR